MVPLLVLVFHYPMKIAISAVLFAMVPYSLMATWMNSRNKLIYWKLGILLEIPTILGAILGSYLCQYVNQAALKTIFSFVVMLAGYVMTGKGNPFFAYLGTKIKKLNQVAILFTLDNGEGKQVGVGLFSLLLFGGITGITAGLLGIGGGWMKTPVMILLFELSPRMAVGTALFMITMTSTTAASSHFFFGSVDFSLTLTLMAAFPLGAFIGSRFLPKIQGDTHRILIGACLFCIGLVMLLTTFLL